MAKSILGILLSIILMSILIGLAVSENPQVKITNPSFNSKTPNKVLCSDFKTHTDAQTFFDSHGGSNGAYAKLDRNHDGIACE